MEGPRCVSRRVKLIGRHEDVCRCEDGGLRHRRLTRGLGPCHPALPVAVEPDDVEVGDEDVETGREELPQKGHLDKPHLEEVGLVMAHVRPVRLHLVHLIRAFGLAPVGPHIQLRNDGRRWHAHLRARVEQSLICRADQKWRQRRLAHEMNPLRGRTRADQNL